jgi:NAD(P)-dependent dehydrogenase (short-subunit alcohol dehydrogenase family)
MSVLDRFRLDGRRAFITGGSRGLGREMALALAEAGADVMLVGREADSLESICAEIRQRGRTATFLIGDIGNPEDCERVCQAALEQSGPFDILINNVGGRRINVPLAEQTLEQWQQILDLNLTSTFLCMKHIGGAMLSAGKGGRVINIASISGIIANRGIGGRSYETSKAAVIQLTRAAAADWAPHRITVNAICPGGFMTAPNVRWSKEHPDVIAQFREQIPMGDLGPPEDLGPLAVYLASDAARYVTGAAFVIDGGYTVW